MPNPVPPFAHNFTVQYPGLARVISSGCGLENPITGADLPENYKPIPFQAIWDTGATNSVITVAAAQILGLIPIAETLVHGVNSSTRKNVYAISLTLPNNVILPYVRVTECDVLSDGFDVLIGMDIIGSGDLAITNSNGQTVFSFRFPSVSRIDFTNSQNNINVDAPPKQTFSQRFKHQTRGQSKGKGKR